MKGRKISKLFENIGFRDRMSLIYCLREFESVNFIEITTESTPLVYAIDRGWIEGVRILIQAGADVNFSNNPESNPLVSAIQIYSTAILEILLEAGANVDGLGFLKTPLIEAIRYENSSCIARLIEAGADLERCCESDVDTLTPLGFAIRGGNSEIVKILLEAGADIHVKPYTDSNQTLLPLAIDRNHLEIAQILIDAGIDLNAIDNGWTALDLARKRRYESMVQLLTTAGAVGDRKIEIAPIDPDEIPF